MALIGRFIRFLIFVLGVGIGAVGTLFAIGNRESIPVAIWTYSFQVPVYALALGPLALGLALGWLYTVPARTQEFNQHWRSWRALRRVEKENKQLRHSLDKVLELPDEEEVAAKGKDVPKLKASEDAVEVEPVAVHDVKPAAEEHGRHREPEPKPAEHKAEHKREEAHGEADLPAELAQLEPIAEARPSEHSKGSENGRPEPKARPKHETKPHARARHEVKPAEHSS